MGSFIASLLVTMPQALSEVTATQGNKGGGQELARWLLEVSESIGRALSKNLPPQQVEKIVGDLAAAVTSLSSVAVELSNTIADPQVAEIIRRASEGFRKSLNTASLQDPLSVMKMLTDPDVAYAAGVLLAALKALGVAIRASSSISQEEA